MLRDGVHTNDFGDFFVRDQVFPLIVKAVQDVIAERGSGGYLARRVSEEGV